MDNNRGTWTCDLCGSIGTGGVNGYRRHYIEDHQQEEW